jgi:hypothetical protein
MLRLREEVFMSRKGNPIRYKKVIYLWNIYLGLPDKECWEVVSHCAGGGGYPQKRINGKLYSIHRLVWSLYNSENKEPECVCHYCDNPLCINPSHLFCGSTKDNNLDRDTKKRFSTEAATSASKVLPRSAKQLKAVASLHSKFSFTEITTIKNRYSSGESIKDIAFDFNVNYSTVWRICKEKSYTTT